MIQVDVRDWLQLVGVMLDDDVIEQILREADVELRRFVAGGADRVTFSSPALLATAAKPR